ncbi:DUF4253 domain-containing protein [Streptomyces sp. NPDC007074]|uniref:DUF4253 domain-containing protein n=1 Tax=Streptomyces sp. NPDC007074 TaxID=3156764 RepID=UPI0033EF2FBA
METVVCFDPAGDKEREMFRFLREVAADLGMDVPVVEHAASPAGVDVYGFRCPADDALRDALWDRLRALHPGTGWWPFISHESPTAWEWDGQPRQAPLPAAATMLAEIVASNVEMVGVHAGEILPAHVRDPVRVARQVASSSGRPAPYARGELIVKHFAHTPGWICLVATDRSSRLPRLLHAPFTPNWTSDGPVRLLGYVEHEAVLREWEARYGACLFYLGAGAMVLEVDRPPTDGAEIARVAVEQFAYCDDLSQVIGDPMSVAERQVPSRHWFFWWD